MILQIEFVEGMKECA